MIHGIPTVCTRLNEYAAYIQSVFVPLQTVSTRDHRHAAYLQSLGGFSAGSICWRERKRKLMVRF